MSCWSDSAARPTAPARRWRLLVTVQFFVSTEVLVITGLFAVVAVALMVGLRRPPRTPGARPASGLRRHGVGHRGRRCRPSSWPIRCGSCSAGPAHLTGPIWSNGTLSHFGNTSPASWTTGASSRSGAESLASAGTRARCSPASVTWGRAWWRWQSSGLLLWRHDRRLLLFGGVGIAAAVLSLGPGHGHWVPWQVVEKVPWVGNIVEIRFTLVIALCAAVMVSVVIDRVRTWVSERRPALPVPADLAAAAVMVVAAGPRRWWPWPPTSR